MLIRIAEVLAAKDVSAARKTLEVARFVDGKATAGWHAKLVKNNMQAGNDAGLQKLRDDIAKHIMGSVLFSLWARPKALTPLLLSRYEPGMNYGSHVDDALMGGMRTDVSFTLFLSDPDTYEGGGLVIETTGGEEVVKLPAGHMVAYPSTTLHRVEEVTKGVRYAAVGWARSFIREPEKREILFDLETARRALFEREGKSGEFDLVSKAGTNLLRMWAED